MADPNDIKSPKRFGAQRRGNYLPYKRVDTAVETAPTTTAADELLMVREYGRPFIEWVCVMDAGISGFTVTTGRWVTSAPAAGQSKKDIDIDRFIVDGTYPVTEDCIIVQEAAGRVGCFITAATGIDASNGVEIAYRGLGQARTTGLIS